MNTEPDAERWKALATQLDQGRQSGTLMDLPAAREDLPLDVPTAYQVQDLLIGAMKDRPVAWKLGAPSLAGQSAMNLAEPFSGPILPGMVLPSPAQIDTSGFAAHLFEPEIAITLGRDIDRAIDEREAAEAIASLHPAIEIIGFRFRNGRSLGPVGMIMDYGANGALVLGPAAKAGVDDYDGLALDVRINGATIANRAPPPPETGLARLLSWFSAHVTARGHSLRTGDVITTGSQAGMLEYQPGDRIEADFGSAGIAAVQV